MMYNSHAYHSHELAQLSANTIDFVTTERYSTKKPKSRRGHETVTRAKIRQQEAEARGKDEAAKEPEA